MAESGGHIDFGVFEISSKETPQLYIIVENIDIAFVEWSRRGEKVAKRLSLTEEDVQWRRRNLKQIQIQNVTNTCNKVTNTDSKYYKFESNLLPTFITK